MKIIKSKDSIILIVSEYEASIIRTSLGNTIGFCMIDLEDNKIISELEEELKAQDIPLLFDGKG